MDKNTVQLRRWYPA